MTKKLSPICLFTYNRLLETQQTIEALKNNYLASESDLYIFSDGPKNEAAIPKVNQVRQYLQSVTGFKSVHIIESSTNKGLANSIISGVGQIVGQHGKVIVLEDDIITSYGFLKYMNSALEYYNDKKEVMQVSGFMFPIDAGQLPDTFFYQANTCWGWATWQRAWDHFTNDERYLLNELKSKGITWAQFNSLQGREFQNQLIRNINGSMKTWAVKWHATIKIHNGKVLHPKISYVANIGFNGSGENCPKGDIVGSINNEIDLDVSAAEKYSEKLALQRLAKHFKKRYSIFQKVKRKINHYLT
jgi:hypothetical protein